MPHCSAGENFRIDFTQCGIFHFVETVWRRDESHRAANALPASEESELLWAVADQEILGLLVMVEHHLVGLAANARLLVAAECRMRRVGVVAIGPDPSGLDRPSTSSRLYQDDLRIQLRYEPEEHTVRATMSPRVLSVCVGGGT